MVYTVAKTNAQVSTGYKKFYRGIPCTLKDVQDILPHYFVRCHRTIIVNSTKIIGMDTRESTLVLENEITVPYSRANTKELKGTFFKKEKAE